MWGIVWGELIIEDEKASSKNAESLDIIMEAASRFELENNGFAGRRLTTWPSRLWKIYCITVK